MYLYLNLYNLFNYFILNEGFCFTVISSSHSVAEVQESIAVFVESIHNLLTGLEQSLFNSHIEALIKEKRKPLSSLFDAADVAW
jgi:secreted Zn-dependent insulinase-like peptidase